jgi:hypothetical protein
MEMQQIIEMLAKMEVDRKADREQMLAGMKANQAKADAHQAKMEALTEMTARIDAIMGSMQAELESAIEDMKINRERDDGLPRENGGTSTRRASFRGYDT